MINGVIFDLGGTLMYFDGKYEEVDQQAVAKLTRFLETQGIATPPDFHARMMTHRKRHWQRAEDTGFEARVQEVIGDVLQELGYVSANGLLPRATATFFAHFEQYWLAFPDAVDTLRELHTRGIKLGVLSNADDEELVYRAVERLKFAPFMNPVLSSAAEPRWRKPDPRIFHLISNAWNLPPHEIVMVGDSPRYDIIGAHRAGMRAILFERGDKLPWQIIPDEFANHPEWQADAVVNTLAEIPAVLNRW